nr:pentatricopeptide repeat-containing protein At5g66520-like [Ipomoea batatas]
MSATELPYHLANEIRQTTEALPNFNYSQKAILNLLNTKCAASFKHLTQVHGLALKTGHFQDHYVAGTLVKCYANPQIGSLVCAMAVFHQTPNPNVFVWNCLIKGCVDNKDTRAAISVYYEMAVSASAKPNKYTYPPLLKACTREQAFQEGMQFHAHAVKYGLGADGHIASAGIQMYSSFGLCNEARNMFDATGALSDVVCSNAMLDGYMKCGDVGRAVVLFECMRDKNCGSWNAMISGFCRNGMTDEARKLFDEMPEKDEISWSAMIDGYNKEGRCKEALEVFNQMQREKTELKKFVLSSVLAACAKLGALDQGMWVHSYIRKNSIPLDAVLGTSLVDMYANCGRLDLAWDAFERTKQKEIFTWNAMIGGLAMHGRAEDALELFWKMQREEFRPNEVTLVAVLSACVHAGFVDTGLEYMITMKEAYGFEPTMEHYGCAVDLLGRAGLLNDAEDLINSMPIVPNAAVWGALLGGCRIHGNVELGARVGNILLEMEPKNSGRYTLLSNIYGKAGKFNEVSRLRKLMKQRGVKTSAGFSTICIDGGVHEFKMGDGLHPEMEDINPMLQKMMERIRLEGYRPNTSEVVFDICEEEKETVLSYHSEKLAMAYGILKTAPGTTIRIVKNLRVCEDCHTATKLISKVYKRDIIVRDRMRYHHFRNGHCSCKDFW